MAGLYILWEKGLARKAEVLRIAQATGIDRRQIAGTLMEFWEWMEDQTETGFLPGILVRNLSACVADTSGAFWAAVQSVGWIVESAEGIEVPRFERWMGKSAKRRARESERKRQSRSPCPQSVRKVSASHADKKRTTEQNRTEQDKSTPLTPQSALPQHLDTDAFRAALSRWIDYRKQIKKPLKPASMDALVRKLAAWGAERAAQSIDSSIANGYQGLFEPKESARPAASTKSLEERVQEAMKCVPGKSG